MSAGLLGLLLLIAMPAPARAQAMPASAPPPAVPLVTPQFRRYGVDDGLPSSNVYAVAQDRSGVVWFGTKGGIARFDGVQFQVFRHVSNDPGSLSDNGISTLLVDSRNRLWASGLNAGLNRYDATTGKFVHWGHDPADPTSLSSARVWSLAQTPDGALWVGTDNGLDRLRPDGHGFDHVEYQPPAGKAENFGAVGALHVDAHGQLWIGTDLGVFRRDTAGRMHRVLAADPHDSMSAWNIDSDGDEVRIATDRGLMVVGADGLARRFGGTAIPATNVMDSKRDRAGRLWIGTQRGLFMQPRPGAPVMAITNHPVLNGNLPGSWVWHMLVDRAGGLWLAVLDGGVGYLAPGWGSFSRFTHIPDDPASLRDAVATTMARGKDDLHVWVGERAGRVDRLDPVTGQVEHVLSNLDGDVVGMTEDSRGRLWVALQGYIAVCDVAQRRCTRIDPGHGVMRHPLEVEPGPDGQMYARTFGEGIFRIDQDTLAVTPVPMDLPNERVRWGSQMTLRDGVFWYASDGGMMQFDRTRGRFAMAPGATPGQGVDAFAFAVDGMWTANANGLSHYRIEGNAMALDRTVDSAQGWPSINVVDLKVDSQDRVWVFGHDGLWRFDPASGHFRSFGLQDGLANGEFSRGYAEMPSGYLYAATLGGVVAFDPDRIGAQKAPPPLAITGVTVRRRGVRQALPIERGVVHVGWRDRQLSIQARVFSYLDPYANRYRFFLHGFDPGWVDVGNPGERDLSGLGSGDYTLEVMAAGAEGVWTHLAQPLHIHVQSPPWLRWWAWLLYALALASAASLLMLEWQRRLAQRHHVDLIEQRHALAEQANAAKTQFLATLSHEIRTPMTGVMGMAELLLNTPLDSRQRDYTRAMQRSGGMLLKLLNDALDLVRIDAGRFELEPSPYDPRQVVLDVAQLEQGMAWSKGLQFVVEVADNFPALVVGDAVRIKQVLLNLVNNALKFTEHGSITLRATRSGDDLLFSVSDTGPGIPGNSQSRLFRRFEQEESPQRRAGSGLGLAICRELVEMMGGRIELQSRLGHGSTFLVRLPLIEASPAPPEPALPPPTGGRRLHLLLVEDDAIAAAVVTGLLQQQGHATRHVANGLQALAELERERYDAVLLDLDLPGLDGFQIARLIRQRETERRLPIVAVTARTSDGDEALARAAGMDGFLRKPVSGEQLAAMLAGVLEGGVPA
ncbi:hybrid sensor histidine kinase/response regulator [Rhodanobacter sp. DHB23]|uniref:hybrid sensor histidine kinase/response regulator n=1 Tax=Rhodanobacter sp. DHB23 TaxID=2775923 RepID=UPI001CE1BCC4|nr:hybrid sensor histidine kinase/response regulator [Rhodanobacter sp. DHB23]